MGLTGLVYGFLESAFLGWRHPVVLGSLTGGFALIALFLLVESRVVAPMVPLELFKAPSFRAANLLTLFLYAGTGIFFFLFPLNLIQVQKFSPTATGAAALPMILLIFSLSRWSGGLVARYGARLPLTIGPLIAAVGFLLCMVPSVNANYWTTFFPAFIVLGLGMATSVAPLTTVVMSSVEEDRAGIASGINNAVARVAGVLAVAVLGAVMVASFSHSLRGSLRSLRLDPVLAGDVESKASRLGGLDPPANQDPGTQEEIRSAVQRAFVSGFRTVMLFSAALALASAVTAWRMIPSRGREVGVNFQRGAAANEQAA
jgi:predicted MFS family arabinose efflux permease